MHTHSVDSQAQVAVPSLLSQVTRVLLRDRGVVPGLSNWRRTPAPSRPGTVRR